MALRIGDEAPNFTAQTTEGEIDFHLLLDNTPSMGVGATMADINTLVANTPDKCAFACHDLSATPNDYYGLAKKLGVTMRIDVVRSATEKLMDTAKATQTVDGQYRAAIYTFGWLSAAGTSCTRRGSGAARRSSSALSSASAWSASRDSCVSYACRVLTPWCSVTASTIWSPMV